MATSSQLQPDVLPEYNILLLGESGAGKTLFINSFINYVQYETLDDAQKGPVSVVIPIKFTITDDRKVPRDISEGEHDSNEYLENTAHSSTVNCRSYLINFETFRVRLIDTPGVGSTVTDDEINKEKQDKHSGQGSTVTGDDVNKEQPDKHSKGVEQDKKYVDEVLEFIRYFDHLHAIVIVVKSNETRCTPKFEQNLQHLLSSFNKSAIDNLFFILTFGESSRFNADIVKAPLKTLLKKVTASTSDQLLNDNKVYCVDNKGFRYLLAVKNKAWFKPLEKMVCENAWAMSRDECKRLVGYITGQGTQPELEPHKVTDTLSIKDARKFINMVEKLMENVLKVIEHNKAALEGCLTWSTEDSEKIAAFKKLLTEKQQDVEVVQVKLPQTSCTSPKCTTKYNVDGEEKALYSQICCQGCKATITRRQFCEAIELTSGNCKKCGCHVMQHRRDYYTTQIVSKDIKNKDDILKELASAKDNKQKLQIAKKHAVRLLQQIDNEKTVIGNAQNVFKNFLKTNPIIPSEGENGSVADVIPPDEVLAFKKQLINPELFGQAIQNAYGKAKQGEKDDWLTNKLDLTKEKLIRVKNTFSNWYHKQPDNGESEVRHCTAIEPISLNDFSLLTISDDNV